MSNVGYHEMFFYANTVFSEESVRVALEFSPYVNDIYRVSIHNLCLIRREITAFNKRIYN